MARLYRTLRRRMGSKWPDYTGHYGAECGEPSDYGHGLERWELKRICVRNSSPSLASVRARAALVCCIPVWLRFHRSCVGLFVAVFVFRRLLRRDDVKEVVRNKKMIVKIFLPKTWDWRRISTRLPRTRWRFHLPPPTTTSWCSMASSSRPPSGNPRQVALEFLIPRDGSSGMPGRW